jgi:hypothetical protein
LPHDTPPDGWRGEQPELAVPLEVLALKRA